jgi:hypothetical protein
MKLIIDTQDENFAKVYIPQVLTEYVITKYRDASAKKLNAYLEGFNVKQTVRTILLYAVETLKIRQEGKEYILEVDKNKNVPNTVFSLETVVNLITYGAVDVKGYDIMLKAFNFVSKKLNMLKRIYAAKEKEKGE